MCKISFLDEFATTLANDLICLSIHLLRLTRVISEQVDHQLVVALLQLVDHSVVHLVIIMMIFMMVVMSFTWSLFFVSQSVKL